MPTVQNNSTNMYQGPGENVVQTGTQNTAVIGFGDQGQQVAQSLAQTYLGGRSATTDSYSSSSSPWSYIGTGSSTSASSASQAIQERVSQIQAGTTAYSSDIPSSISDLLEKIKTRSTYQAPPPPPPPPAPVYNDQNGVRQLLIKIISAIIQLIMSQYK